MQDLWAEDIGTETIKMPVAVLREQASFLGSKTQNIVLAEVVSLSEGHGKDIEFVCRFNLKAPALGNYSYTLFFINHGIDPYPLRMFLDGTVAKELGWTDEYAHTTDERWIISEDELLEILEKILKAERTKHVIRALRDQSLEYKGLGETADM